MNSNKWLFYSLILFKLLPQVKFMNGMHAINEMNEWTERKESKFKLKLLKATKIIKTCYKISVDDDESNWLNFTFWNIITFPSWGSHVHIETVITWLLFISISLCYKVGFTVIITCLCFYQVLIQPIEDRMELG